jgi:hypothetical protein
MTDANRSSILRFQHVLEASVVFAVLTSVVDVSHLALLQPRLASDPLASLRLIATVSVLTAIPYLVILSICLPIVRWISRAANRPLDLSLTLIYSLAALPAGVILLRSVAISVAEQSAILTEVKILVYFLKYVFLLVPMCWALGAWLSEIRRKTPYAQLLGRASGLCFAALVFLILTPMLLTRYSTGTSAAQNASTEGLIIVGGMFVLSILLLPLAIRVAAALAGSRKGAWLGVVWIAALILPFVRP